jgi:hypothetical protein
MKWYQRKGLLLPYPWQGSNEDGLNVEKMLKSFGGRAQRKMRETTIKKSQGYRGPSSPNWRHGINGVQWIETGRFWIAEVQREETRHD